MDDFESRDRRAYRSALAAEAWVPIVKPERDNNAHPVPSRRYALDNVAPALAADFSRSVGDVQHAIRAFASTQIERDPMGKPGVLTDAFPSR